MPLFIKTKTQTNNDEVRDLCDGGFESMFSGGDY
jgi:hypothetical protein